MFSFPLLCTVKLTMSLIIILVISIIHSYQIEHVQASVSPSANSSLIFELIEKGNSFSNLGRYNEAITYYDKALAIDPKQAEALYNKGAMLGNLGKHEEAIV